MSVDWTARINDILARVRAANADVRCFDCSGVIRGPVFWLGADPHADRGHIGSSGVVGPYPFHPVCARKGWPELRHVGRTEIPE